MVVPNALPVSGEHVIVPVTPQIKSVLDRARSMQRVRKVGQGDAYVFQEPAGSAYSKTGWNSMWKRARLKAGLVDTKINSTDVRPYAMACADCAIRQLLDDALAAKTNLRPSTRKQYRQAAAHLRHAFQQFRCLDQIQPRHVAEFRRTMSGTPNMANRCLSVLRMALDYALEMQWIDSNPAIGIRRHREQQRGRLLSAQEYGAIYRQAGPRLQVIMDLCYLTGQRISDVLAIRRSQIRDGGIEFAQGKTGARLLVRAPGLPEVIERALALHGAVRALTLFRSRLGGAPKYGTIRDQWEQACTAAGVKDAHLHDLRALALTEADRAGLDAQALAGHTSEAMTRRYLRSKEVPEVTGPALSRIRGGRDRQ